MTIATTLWLLAIAALLGVFLVVRGWRGRRIDDHPLCRKCGYDLHANASPARSISKPTAKAFRANGRWAM